MKILVISIIYIMLLRTKAFSTLAIKSYFNTGCAKLVPSTLRSVRCMSSTKKNIDHFDPDVKIRFKGNEGEEDGWEVHQLSDDDASELNKMLRHKEEVPQAKAVPKGPKPLTLDEEVGQDFELLRIKGFLELNPQICSGCGANFQTKAPDSPGYLTKEKFKEHREKSELIREKQSALSILNTAGIDVHSPLAAEILTKAKVRPEVLEGLKLLVDQQDLINERKMARKNKTDVTPPPKPTPEESELQAKEGINSLQKLKRQQAAVSDHVCICQRCFRLQQYGKVEDQLRPGWSQNELLTPERFQSLVSVIKDSKSVVLCLVDLFDLQGSLLPNLKEIAGSNPIVIAANKLDLLPKDISMQRVMTWLHSEVKYVCQLSSPDEARADDRAVRTGMYIRNYHDHKVSEAGVLRRQNIHLISCTNGAGLDDLMRTVYNLAQNYDKKVHVMGAANVGKSSFINRLLETKYKAMNGGSSGSKRILDRRSDENPLATVSSLPGTTLNFLRIKMPNGVTIIDTPGLLNKDQLTSKLTTEELKQVIPHNKIRPVTLRLEEGKCILLGGLAKVELIEVRESLLLLVFLSIVAVLYRARHSSSQSSYPMISLFIPPARSEPL